MVATDMYGKSPYGSGLAFSFRFLIVTFYNLCYILHSTIALLFVHIPFLNERWRHRAATTSEAVLNGGICLGCCSSPRSTSFFMFFQCKEFYSLFGSIFQLGLMFHRNRSTDLHYLVSVSYGRLLEGITEQNLFNILHNQ